MARRPNSLSQIVRSQHPELQLADSRADRARRLADPAQATAERVRSSQRWKDLRALVLAREPLCVGCSALGRTMPASTVDHVEPIALRPDLAFVEANLQPLCTACHAAKSARERAMPEGGGAPGLADGASATAARVSATFSPEFRRPAGPRT